MSAQSLRIATLLVSGVAIGVTLGAVAVSTLPVWLGACLVPVLLIAGICGASK